MNRTELKCAETLLSTPVSELLSRLQRLSYYEASEDVSRKSISSGMLQQRLSGTTRRSRAQSAAAADKCS